MAHGEPVVNKVGGSSPKCHRKAHYYGCNQLGYIVKKCPAERKERRIRKPAVLCIGSETFVEN